MQTNIPGDRNNESSQSQRGNEDASLPAKLVTGDMGDKTIEITDLLERMRMGDREAAAAFVMRFGHRIRRRIRGKLSPAMRRIFDSRDILSTVGRRLDRFVESGKVQAVSEPQLWSLVFRIASNAVIEKGRIMRRLRRLEGEDGVFAQEILSKLRKAERVGSHELEIEIERVIEFVNDEVDKEILCLWLSGTSHDITSICVNLAPTAVRKRWQKIKIRLRERFETEIQS